MAGGHRTDDVRKNQDSTRDREKEVTKSQFYSIGKSLHVF